MRRVRCITANLPDITFGKEYDVVEYIPQYKFFLKDEMPGLKIINDNNIEKVYPIRDDIYGGGWYELFQDISTQYRTDKIEEILNITN